MADTGETAPSTMADDAAVGTGTWANVDNAKIDDTAYASNLVWGQTHYLKATNFGFSIPGGATVDGIVVKIIKQNLDTIPPNTVFDNAVKLVNGGGTVVGDNKADVNVWTQGSDDTITYGGAADDWNASLDDTDVNNSNFGVVITADQTRAFGGGPIGAVDFIAVTIHYTAGAGVTNPKVKVSGTFSTKTIKTKISGTFTEKPLMVKVGGTFQ